MQKYEIRPGRHFRNTFEVKHCHFQQTYYVVYFPCNVGAVVFRGSREDCLAFVDRAVSPHDRGHLKSCAR